jgi:hypothetical protein
MLYNPTMTESIHDPEIPHGLPSQTVSDEDYFRSVGSFYSSLADATALSRAAAARQAGERRHWASVLFTRLCNTACSVIVMCPRNPFNHPDRDHWDMSAIASLTRNLVECAFALNYLAFDEVGDDEWFTRLNLMQLHDCVTRFKMFSDLTPDDPEIRGFEGQAEELRNRLLTRKHFASLPEKQQKRFLTGDHAWLLTQDEILARMGQGENKRNFRGMWRYLSTHAHTYPVAFYRMAEQGTGRGLENNKEKGMITLVLLPYGEDVLRDATKRFNALFPDIDIPKELAAIGKREGKRMLRSRTLIR